MAHQSSASGQLSRSEPEYKVLIDEAMWARFTTVALAEPDAPDVKMILDLYRWLLKCTLN
jgi:hypothetical protein